MVENRCSHNSDTPADDCERTCLIFFSRIMFLLGSKKKSCELIEATTSCKNSGDTSPSWGVINLPIIFHTAAPLPPLISDTSKTKKCWKLKQSTLKGGEGRGSGKGLSSRYGGHWKLEKVFFYESVSTILQLVVG